MGGRYQERIRWKDGSEVNGFDSGCGESVKPESALEGLSGDDWVVDLGLAVVWKRMAIFVCRQRMRIRLGPTNLIFDVVEVLKGLSFQYTEAIKPRLLERGE